MSNPLSRPLRASARRLPVTGALFVSSLLAYAYLAPWLRAQPTIKPKFVNISPDFSGPSAGCPTAPCISAGSGGRVHTVASSNGRPGDFYAASELGGLFRRMGPAWTHLSGFLPTKAWDVEVDPEGDIVYATSFYDGRIPTRAGIQVSQDRGQTWTRPPSVDPPSSMCDADRMAAPSAFGISVRPGTPNEVLVGTNCGLALSSDYGASWEYVDPASTNGHAKSVWDVVALEGGLTYACGQNGVMKSPDGRTAWEMVTTPAAVPPGVPLPGPVPYTGFCSLAVARDYPQWVFVVFSHVTYFDPIFDIRDSVFFASSNGGTTWTPMPHPDPVTKQKRVPRVVLNPRTNSFDVWVGAGNLYRFGCDPLAACPFSDKSKWVGSFTDAANDATRVHGDTGNLLFDPTRSTDACPVLYASDGGVYRNKKTISPDCQSPEFEELSQGLHAELLLGMDGVNVAGDANEDLYLAAQDVGLFATRKAGLTPPPWKHGVGADVLDVVADATQVLTVDPDVVGALKREGAGYVGAATVVNVPAEPARQFYTPFSDVIDQWGQASYVMAANDLDVYTTDNLTDGTVAGGSVPWSSTGWQASDGIPCAVTAALYDLRGGGGVRFYALAVLDGDQTSCLWRFQNKLFTKTLDGSQWNRIDVNTECPAGGVGIVGVDRARGGRLYASCLSNAPPTMIRSFDAGQNWQTDHHLTDLMTGPGTFASRFGAVGDGATFGGVQPTLVAFDPRDPNVLVAGGYESGLFISSDGGNGWALLTDPYTPATSHVPHLPRPFFAHFDHPRGGSLEAIYVGTAGRGVWRVTPAQTLLQVNEVALRPCLGGSGPCPPHPCLRCPVSRFEKLHVDVLVRNRGFGEAGNAIFRYTLPPGLSLLSLEAPDPWVCSSPSRAEPGEIVCTTSSLGPRASSRFELQVEVEADNGTTLRSESSIVSNAIDPDPANNTVASAHEVMPLADLQVVQQVSPSRPVRRRRHLTFDIALANAGPVAATDLTLVDVLPRGTSLESVSSGSLSCREADGDLVCPLDELGVGSQVRLTVTVAAEPGQEVTNDVQARAAERDPAPANNRSRVTFPGHR
jgi:uncharacterized repeat protein (TIGR01451 family)